MTPQQINAAIATDLGWETFAEGDFKQYIYWIKPKGGLHKQIPDYCDSLDAIRAAALERFKDRAGLAIVFQGLLNEKSAFERKHTWQLTAADWCEAYLRTVGK